MELDRAAILSAMYQDDDRKADDDGDNGHDPRLSNRLGHIRRIRVGAVEYEVPSVEYVQQLEQMVAQQMQTMRQQRRLIDRMASVLLKTRHSQQGQMRDADALRRELAKKINQRDFAT